MPDLTTISLLGLISLTILTGAADTLISMLIALANGNWSSHYALDFLVSHVAKVWTPITLLGILGQGIVPLDVPAIPLATAAAVGALVVYIGVVIASLKQSFEDRGIAPADKR
jgi:hypothetical protein